MSNLSSTFIKKIKELLDQNEMTQSDLADKLNVSKSAVNNWLVGNNMPRMDKIDQICKIFNIKRSELIGENSYDENYYLSEETRRIANKISKDKELAMLFDAAEDVSAEDLKAVHQLLKSLKKKENHEE